MLMKNDCRRPADAEAASGGEVGIRNVIVEAASKPIEPQIASDEGLVRQRNGTMAPRPHIGSRLTSEAATWQEARSRVSGADEAQTVTSVTARHQPAVMPKYRNRLRLMGGPTAASMPYRQDRAQLVLRTACTARASKGPTGSEKKGGCALHLLDTHCSYSSVLSIGWII